MGIFSRLQKVKPGHCKGNSMANNTTKGLWALSPLAVFLCLYLVTSLVAGDFYKCLLRWHSWAASVYAVLITGA